MKAAQPQIPSLGLQKHHAAVVKSGHACCHFMATVSPWLKSSPLQGAPFVSLFLGTCSLVKRWFYEKEIGDSMACSGVCVPR